jgi:ribosome-associated toxin RatA of RatAB toxin-antitoxin module
MEVRRSALVDHAAEHVFDVIEGAEHYPSFLPWCAGATILARDDTLVVANIAVDWHGLRFQFRTRNPKRRPEWLAVVLEEGPFRRFEGEWHLRPLAPFACKVEFAMHYEFDSAVVGKVAGSVFERIVGTFVDAFVARADVVYHSQRANAANDCTIGKELT